MAYLSNTILNVVLPNGDRAVYDVQPQHLNEIEGTDLNLRAIQYGKQLAHQQGDKWYKSGGWEEITDLRTIALLERAPEA